MEVWVVVNLEFGSIVDLEVMDSEPKFATYEDGVTALRVFHASVNGGDSVEVETHDKL